MCLAGFRTLISWEMGWPENGMWEAAAFPCGEGPRFCTWVTVCAPPTFSRNSVTLCEAREHGGPADWLAPPLWGPSDVPQAAPMAGGPGKWGFRVSWHLQLLWTHCS